MRGDYQELCGLRFRETVCGHYELTMRIHQLKWILAYGSITPGKHIHHIDGNKANNDISNLVELTPSEHARAHAKDTDEEGISPGARYYREWRAKNPGAAAKHQSRYKMEHAEDIRESRRRRYLRRRAAFEVGSAVRAQ